MILVDLSHLALLSGDIMILTEELKNAIITHAEQCFPEECCGVIVNNRYIPCKNDSADPENTFKINQLDLDRAEDLGHISAYVHSHPNGSARPSDYDKLKIEQFEKPWIICSFPDCEFTENYPCGYKPPLIGRNFYHGWQDCYSLLRDFYSRELGIELSNFERKDNWWEDKDSPSLYVENFASEGFVQVDLSDIQYGDIMLFSIRSSHTNHAAIYLGSNDQLKSEKSEKCVGSAIMLHHLYGKLSNRELISSFWIDRLTHVIRYRGKGNA